MNASNSQTENRQLIDSFNRQIRYLRLSVTDRCNLRCTYCMVEKMTFLPKKQILTLEELTNIAQAFVNLGVEKIRLTGGEPLVRKGVIGLAQSLAGLSGLKQLAMTTNGVLLNRFAKPLRDAGVSRLNISLDSLQAERFAQLSRTGSLEQVLQGIASAQQAGFERLKLNAVIMKGKNDDEVIALTRFALEQGCDITFIEEMPLGEVEHQRIETQLSSESIKQQLDQEFELLVDICQPPTAGPARYLRIADSDTRVGFISPISNNFCGSCNRVRLTAEGRLLLCLGNQDSLDLRSIIRQQPNDPQALQNVIIQAMQHKPERHYFNPNKITIVRHMNRTGG